MQVLDDMKSSCSVLPVQCYAGTGTSYGPVSVCHQLYSIKRDGWIELVFLAQRLLLTYATLIFKEIQASAENFATAQWSSSSVSSIISSFRSILIVTCTSDDQHLLVVMVF